MENYDISLFLNDLLTHRVRLISYKRMIHYVRNNHKWLNDKIIFELRLIIKDCERLIDTINFNDGM